MSGSLVIKIPLTPNLIKPAEAWVKTLNAGDFCQMADALIVNNNLHANAYDIIELINIAEEQGATELEFRRFKKLAIQSVERSISRRKHWATILNLQTVLETLNRVNQASLSKYAN